MDNVTLLKGLYDAFGRGDMPTVLGAMNPGIQWHQAESNPTCRAEKPLWDRTLS